MSKPSESELRLLRHLWRAKQLSARELHDATFGETQWSFSTTRKTLDRMVDKGIVRVELVHGLKTFVAATSKLETLASFVNDFARNVLDLDGPLPTATFANSRVVDPDEVEALEALLVKHRAKNGKGRS